MAGCAGVGVGGSSCDDGSVHPRPSPLRGGAIPTGEHGCSAENADAFRMLYIGLLRNCRSDEVVEDVTNVCSI